MDEINHNQEQFIKERMKQRPLNRKKLMRRTIVTALMAVIFGVLACFTFLVLEPVFTNFLYPEDDPISIEIPEDTEEMLPEDMLQEEVEEETVPIVEQVTAEIDPLELYRSAIAEIRVLSNTTMKSMVTVIGASRDAGWFNDAYTSENQTSAVFIAANGKELLFLLEVDNIIKAEEIHVKFRDGSSALGQIKQTDANTGLGIIAVPLAEVNESIVSNLVPVTLGNSKVQAGTMTPVVVIGHPYGTSETYVLGNIVTSDTSISMTDYNYNLLTTDIYGSANATGIIINLKGEVLGIVEQSFNSNDMNNIITAYGVSDLKSTIERMSNGKTRALLGITGIDVSSEAHDEMNVPYGAYVTGIVMNSPAMNAGIQSGDIIVKINDLEIMTYMQLANYLIEKSPDDEVTITIMRQTQDEYREVELTLVLAESK